MKFAIRDDDTSFWTRPEELEFVYKKIWAKGIPVSIAIIPFSVKFYFSSNREKFYQDEKLKPIGENRELIEFLKEKIKENKISIMLHGFSHQYKVAKWRKGTLVLATKENLDELKKYKKGRNLCWYGEYNWKPYEQLKEETKRGKEYLEDIFHTRIMIFVPPSNDISKEGVKALAESRLNLSGTMRLSKLNRPVNLCSIKNWFIKFWWRLKYDRVYPYVMDYVTHKELHAYGLVPGVTLEELRNHFKFCYDRGTPFVLATHYWEVGKLKELGEILEKFMNSFCKDTCESTGINELFEK